MIKSAPIQYHFVRSHTDNPRKRIKVPGGRSSSLEVQRRIAPIEHVDVVVPYDWDTVWLLAVENFELLFWRQRERLLPS